MVVRPRSRTLALIAALGLGAAGLSTVQVAHAEVILDSGDTGSGSTGDDDGSSSSGSDDTAVIFDTGKDGFTAAELAGEEGGCEGFGAASGLLVLPLLWVGRRRD